MIILRMVDLVNNTKIKNKLHQDKVNFGLIIYN
jgi:hypothetical protein